MIYLDFNATTPIATEVADAMLPYLRGHFGNPASQHTFGVKPREAVAVARRQVARLLGASPEEIVFTSGGTESNNHALRGAAELRRQREGRSALVTSAIEHPAVMEVCKQLEREGFALQILPVDGEGRVDAASLRQVVDENTALVSVMHANNEVGTIADVAELASIAHSVGAWMHSDAAQSAGKIPLDVDALGVDLLSIAGHKLYGPKGVGALFVRQGLELPPWMLGAAQEQGRRAGTENVLGIVGLGAACAYVGRDLAARGQKLRALRDQLHETLVAALGDGVRLNGPQEGRLPNTLSLGFADRRADELMAALDGKLALSAGAACKSGEQGISAVLRAMAVEARWALGTLRLSLGEGLDSAQIQRAAQLILAAVEGCG